ncbi:MAG: hypothetical protein EXX96DRAFT_559383 [Benjaminiella poitrasii]|nr:MAG: hypothetical protein EXX96DRAFT_559383 [Benjaminiella poitrasii]
MEVFNEYYSVSQFQFACMVKLHGFFLKASIYTFVVGHLSGFLCNMRRRSFFLTQESLAISTFSYTVTTIALWNYL